MSLEPKYKTFLFQKLDTSESDIDAQTHSDDENESDMSEEVPAPERSKSTSKPLESATTTKR